MPPRDAIDDRAEYIGQLFAVLAAMAVQNAQILAQSLGHHGRLQVVHHRTRRSTISSEGAGSEVIAVRSRRK